MAEFSTERLTKEDCVRIAAHCYEHPDDFCKIFLQHLFPPAPGEAESELPWFQLGALAVLTGKVSFLEKYPKWMIDKIISNFVLIKEDWDPLEHKVKETIVGQIFHRDEAGHLCMTLAQHLLLIFPRGFSKTTIAGVAVPLYNTVYHNVDFTLYVSHAEDHAVMQLDNAKRQIETNQRLIAVFGELKPARTDIERWSARQYETTSGVAAAARGAGGQVRGLLHNGRRPQLVLVDDLEDSKEVKSETVRKNVREWFMADLKPVLPKMDTTARIVMLGTITHPDCLLEHLKRDPTWSVVQMGVYDREGDLLWARNMDKKKIAAEQASFAAMGELSKFFMEYHSKRYVEEAQIFKQDRFQYGIPEERILAMALAMDPAISEKRTADETVIALMAVTVRGNKVVLDYWHERTSDEKRKLDKYFEMIRNWNMMAYANRFGIESVAYQASLSVAAKERMFREGLYFEIDPLTGKGSKISRIKGALLPPHLSGHLWFARHFPHLEQQLVLFREDGSHEHDDGPDAVAFCALLCDEFASLAVPLDVPLGQEHQLEPIEDILEGGFLWAR